MCNDFILCSSLVVPVNFPRFYGHSHMTFEPLKNSYQTFQITLEFKVKPSVFFFLSQIFVFQKGEKIFETVSLWYRQTLRTACCYTVERMNTAEETLPHWLWCEASCTTGKESSDPLMGLFSQRFGWWIKAAYKTLKKMLAVAYCWSKETWL